MAKVNEEFEKLYLSLVKKQTVQSNDSLMPSLRYGSNENEQHYRPREYQRFKTNNVAPRGILSKIGKVSCEDLERRMLSLKNAMMMKSTESEQRTTVCQDPGPWNGKSWIFVNQTLARGSRKSSKRSLESALKRLRDLPISGCSPRARPRWTCCRCHLFLKRNIRLCKGAQKTSIFEDQGKKKRKLPNSGRKSRRPKKYVPSNREEDTAPQIGQKARKTYSFVLDSRQEEIADPEIKSSKLEIRNTGKKTLLSNTETSSNSGRTTPFTVEPMGHDARPTSKYPVHAGSFREQLEKPKMEEMKSGIIKEN